MLSRDGSRSTLTMMLAGSLICRRMAGFRPGGSSTCDTTAARLPPAETPCGAPVAALAAALRQQQLGSKPSRAEPPTPGCFAYSLAVCPT